MLFIHVDASSVGCPKVVTTFSAAAIASTRLSVPASGTGSTLPSSVGASGTAVPDGVDGALLALVDGATAGAAVVPLAHPVRASAAMRGTTATSARFTAHPRQLR